MAGILYGSGLRLLECCRLRVQDIDLVHHEIMVRRGKGARDRRTMLPARLASRLEKQIAAAFDQHQADVAAGAGHVELPNVLVRKYPNASRQWSWQWVFPATRQYRDDAT